MTGWLARIDRSLLHFWRNVEQKHFFFMYNPINFLCAKPQYDTSLCHWCPYPTSHFLRRRSLWAKKVLSIIYLCRCQEAEVVIWDGRPSPKVDSSAYVAHQERRLDGGLLLLELLSRLLLLLVASPHPSLFPQPFKVDAADHGQVFLNNKHFFFFKLRRYKLSILRRTLHPPFTFLPLKTLKFDERSVVCIQSMQAKRLCSLTEFTFHTC